MWQASRLLTAATVAIAAVAVIVLTTIPLAGSAQARASVTSSSPADGAALTGPPTEVELTLSGSPDPAQSHVSVRDRAGSAVNTGQLGRVGGDRLRQPVAISSAGDFTVAYHVVLTDGQEVIGSMRFSVGTGQAPVGAAAADAPHAHGIDPVSAVVLVIDGAVLLGVLVMLFLRPRTVSGPGGMLRRGQGDE